jgi:predicted nucleic-acid-binding protein
MIAVDTNIIVRFLVRDDEKQAGLARRRLKQAEDNRERLLIPLLVVLETIWVLESAYDKTRAEILDAIRTMRQMPIFEFQANDVVERLLADGAAYSADLADILIAHSVRTLGCESGITFDKGAAKLPFFNLLK